MSFNAKLTTAIILMLTMLTQVFAASLSCAHHSNNQSASHSLVMESVQPHQHSHHLTQLHEQHNMVHSTSSLEMNDCHADAMGLQMNSDDCHCTAFIAFELMPVVANVMSNGELISNGINFYQSKPAPGFITSIYHPPHTA